MKISQHVTNVCIGCSRCLLATSIVVLLLVSPLTYAEETSGKNVNDSISESSGSDGWKYYSNSRKLPNTIVIGRTDGSIPPNSAAGSTAISTIVIQEQTIASPYK